MPQQQHIVLVVDDEPAIREMLHDVLLAEGHHVEVASDGHEGLERLREEPRPCIVLMDMLMPRLNGWQMAAEMQGDPALTDIPLVVIAANPRFAADAERIGADRWLGKPIDLDRLFGTVEELCSVSRAGHALPRAEP